eukprot:TRINITY_DN1168_c0_g1_i1.p3 TRINITY_DN1168_c0_g1~~TRINITY_DN1168_c0_g1_i1.p3  ORF type:complete len:161 (+),score=24.55 TRINITY_DN1168_c0_g1_i1:53-535(+)
MERDPGTSHRLANSIHVRYTTMASKKYWKLLCCSSLICCGCLNTSAALRRTYLEVHENRVEFNEAVPWLCGVHDWVSVVYFDRRLAEAAGRASCCTPSCTHCQCFPTCCDLCGEGVVLHRSRCRCCAWRLVRGYDNVDSIVHAIHAAKSGQAAIPVATMH